jgi:medium-chain acyl-[acyl-carrier-protein] hydrolase
MTISDSEFFSRLPNSQSTIRFFCFPHAGGGPAAFSRWATMLPPEVEFCAIRLPGRETRLRQKPFTHIEPLVGELVDALEPLLDKDFIFYGHSMGSLVAFETARELRRRGLSLPLHFIVSARRAMYLPNPDADLYRMPAAQLLGELHERYGGIPIELLKDRELLNLFIPTLRADVTVLGTYTFVDEAPLDCPISAFGGLKDRAVSRADLEGWATLTSNSFDLQLLDGDHFFVQQETFMEALKAILLSYL